MNKLKAISVVVIFTVAGAITPSAFADAPTISMYDTRQQVIAKVDAKPSRTEKQEVLGVVTEKMYFKTGLASGLVVTLVFDRVVSVAETRESSFFDFFNSK